jgi:hypothetical protein
METEKTAAERRKELATLLFCQSYLYYHDIIRAEMLIEFQTRPSQKDEAIRLLAEAGALIAAEIDRINKLSTK